MWISLGKYKGNKTPEKIRDKYALFWKTTNRQESLGNTPDSWIESDVQDLRFIYKVGYESFTYFSI